MSKEKIVTMEHNPLAKQAHALISEKMSPRTSSMLVRVEKDLEQPSYTETALLIPEPFTVEEAIQYILLASVLKENGWEDVNAIPTIIPSLVSSVASEVGQRYEESLSTSETIAVEESMNFYLPYRYVDMTVSSTVSLIVTRGQVMIQTSEALFVKKNSTDLIQKNSISEMKAVYNSERMNFRMKVPTKYQDILPEINGVYKVFQ